jgi:hypothetical protein
MATIGTILIQAANQATSMSGGGMPSAPGTGGDATSDLKHQKTVEAQGAQANAQADKAPKFWTAAFKKMGIQMGLAGILKQSQIFTSTIGSIFQIFGAFVDVILAPFVPMFIPAIRWMARQLPTVAKAAQSAADGIQKTVKAVWGWFFGGAFKSNVKELFTGAIGTIKEAFSWLTSNPFVNWVTEMGTGLKKGVKDWYADVLAGEHVSIGSILGNSVGFTFPGGGNAGAVTHSGGPGSRNMGSEENNTPTTVTPPPPPGGSVFRPFQGDGGDDFGVGEGLTTSAAAIAAAKLAQIALTSVKPRNIMRNPNLDSPDYNKGLKGRARRAFGFMDDVELNPLRKIPGSGLAKMGVNAIVKPPELVAKGALKLLAMGGEGLNIPGFGPSGLSSTGIQPPGGAASKPPVGQGFFGNLDAGPEGKYNAGSNADVLAKLKGQSPTKLSNAVNAFNDWVKKASGKMKNAAGAGANAFKGLYDEGFSLADDVVKLAGKTPGMGYVGGMVSVGFKRVIPGIAGAYMVGETIADIWQIVNSKASWLGDWKSLESYKAEAMGAFFGQGGINVGGLSIGGNPIGALTNLFGKAQSSLGLGDNISNWQDQIEKNRDEKGVLSSGKLMDAIIRGTTGIGGAALSTFFPGLGTIAGTALYEGGRYQTTGINIPGVGQVGGDREKYGEARDFSDRIISAIEAGFSRGVSDVPII